MVRYGVRLAFLRVGVSCWSRIYTRYPCTGNPTATSPKILNRTSDLTLKPLARIRQKPEPPPYGVGCFTGLLVEARRVYFGALVLWSEGYSEGFISGQTSKYMIWSGVLHYTSLTVDGGTLQNSSGNRP